MRIRSVGYVIGPFILVGSILFSLVLACSSGKECKGTIKVDGKSYRAAGNNLKDAKTNGCYQFCLETDRETERLYQKWLDSLPSEKKRDHEKAYKDRATGKFDARHKDRKIWDAVSFCHATCLRDVEAGTYEVNHKCK